MNLKNLSIEELEKLRLEIDSLILKKFIPKYKENTCFINPSDLSYGYIVDVIGSKYEISLNSFTVCDPLQRISEQYLDNCIIISQDDYNELYISKNDSLQDFYKFRDKKQKEIQVFKESLETKFKDMIQEMIKEYKNES